LLKLGGEPALLEAHRRVFRLLFSLLLAAICVLAAPPAGALSRTLVQHAEEKVARVKDLVASGALPRRSLDEALDELADAQDNGLLWDTLYSGNPVGAMTSEEAKTMVDAAQRRVDRQAKKVEDRRKLLDSGVLSRSEFTPFSAELDDRQSVLSLARDRAALLIELQSMAAAEKLAEDTRKGSTLQESMIRYAGDGSFEIAQLSGIQASFEKQFHHVLPVSAVGETAVHESLGLDHRNRVDVALNPEGVEGLWLRQFLEHARIPYLAFRAAVVGAATGPHIHIGLESTRLRN
jgi:hypothetical protein